MCREASNEGHELSIDVKNYTSSAQIQDFCVCVPRQLSFLRCHQHRCSQKRAAEKAVRAEEKLVQRVARGEA